MPALPDVAIRLVLDDEQLKAQLVTAKQTLIDFAESSKSEFKAFGGDISEIRKQVDSLGSAFGTLKNITLAFAGFEAVKRFTSSLIDLNAETQQIKSALISAAGSAHQGALEFRFVEDTAQRLGKNVEALAMQYSRFLTAARSTNVPLEQARNLFVSVNEAATAFGLSSDRLQRVFMGFNMMMNQGVITAHGLSYSLGRTLPGVMEEFKNRLKDQGVDLNEALKKGGLSFQQYAGTLGESIKSVFKSEDVARGASTLTAELTKLHNSIQNLKQAFTGGLFEEMATATIRDTRRIIDTAKEMLGAMGSTTAAIALRGAAYATLASGIVKVAEKIKDLVISFAEENQLTQASRAAAVQRASADLQAAQALSLQVQAKLANLELDKLQLARDTALNAAKVQKAELELADVRAKTANVGVTAELTNAEIALAAAEVERANLKARSVILDQTDVAVTRELTASKLQLAAASEAATAADATKAGGALAATSTLASSAVKGVVSAIFSWQTALVAVVGMSYLLITSQTELEKALDSVEKKIDDVKNATNEQVKVTVEAAEKELKALEATLAAREANANLSSGWMADISEDAARKEIELAARRIATGWRVVEERKKQQAELDRLNAPSKLVDEAMAKLRGLEPETKKYEQRLTPQETLTQEYIAQRKKDSEEWIAQVQRESAADVAAKTRQYQAEVQLYAAMKARGEDWGKLELQARKIEDAAYGVSEATDKQSAAIKDATDAAKNNNDVLAKAYELQSRELAHKVTDQFAEQAIKAKQAANELQGVIYQTEAYNASTGLFVQQMESITKIEGDRAVKLMELKRAYDNERFALEERRKSLKANSEDQANIDKQLANLKNSYIANTKAVQDMAAAQRGLEFAKLNQQLKESATEGAGKISDLTLQLAVANNQYTESEADLVRSQQAVWEARAKDVSVVDAQTEARLAAARALVVESERTVAINEALKSQETEMARLDARYQRQIDLVEELNRIKAAEAKIAGEAAYNAAIRATEKEIARPLAQTTAETTKEQIDAMYSQKMQEFDALMKQSQIPLGSDEWYARLNQWLEMLGRLEDKLKLTSSAFGQFVQKGAQQIEGYLSNSLYDLMTATDGLPQAFDRMGNAFVSMLQKMVADLAASNLKDLLIELGRLAASIFTGSYSPTPTTSFAPTSGQITAAQGGYVVALAAGGEVSLEEIRRKKKLQKVGITLATGGPVSQEDAEELEELRKKGMLKFAGGDWVYGRLMAMGAISGPGTATSDSIPAWLSDGEFVIRAAAVDKYGVEFFNALNQMKAAPPAMPRGIAKFAEGGLVTGQMTKSGKDDGGDVEVNVINQTGQPTSTDRKKMPDGKEIINIVIGQVAADIRGNGPVGQAVQQTFGVARKGVSRG